MIELSSACADARLPGGTCVVCLVSVLIGFYQNGAEHSVSVKYIYEAGRFERFAVSFDGNPIDEEIHTDGEVSLGMWSTHCFGVRSLTFAVWACSYGRVDINIATQHVPLVRLYSKS